MLSANQRSQFVILLPIVLLTVAHAVTCLALFTFRARTGEYPLHSIGFGIYLGVMVFSAVGLLGQFLYTKPMKLEATLLFISLPALTSLVLRGAFWITPWLGGATYAPYDPGDSDIVTAFSLLFAVTLSAVAIIYGVTSYLLIACATQIIIYFGTHALPHWIRYPNADIFGVSPSVFVQMVGIYAVSIGLVFVRNEFLGTRKPHLWLATVTTSLVGAWVLYNTLTWLPTNGMQLWWVSSTTIVPEHAWDWSRLTAQSIAVISIAMTFVSGIAVLLQKWKVTLSHSV